MENEPSTHKLDPNRAMLILPAGSRMCGPETGGGENRLFLPDGTLALGFSAMCYFDIMVFKEFEGTGIPCALNMGPPEPA